MRSVSQGSQSLTSWPPGLEHAVSQHIMEGERTGTKALTLCQGAQAKEERGLGSQSSLQGLAPSNLRDLSVGLSS